MLTKKNWKMFQRNHINARANISGMTTEFMKLKTLVNTVVRSPCAKATVGSKSTTAATKNLFMKVAFISLGYVLIFYHRPSVAISASLALVDRAPHSFLHTLNLGALSLSQSTFQAATDCRYHRGRAEHRRNRTDCQDQAAHRPVR